MLDSAQIEPRVAAGILVFDDVLPFPNSYRGAALRSNFQSVGTPEETFHGIAPAQPFMQALPIWITELFPQLTPTLTVFRKSPLDQREPQFIHEDISMGTWTGLLYLSPNPPAGDGTDFYTHIPTGKIESDRAGGFDGRDDWKDLSKWEKREHVEAKFNRLLLFPSRYFHARALFSNFGTGDEARLIQLVFGTGELA